MKTKIILGLKDGLIQKAKEIAFQQGKSVSKMVEDFFDFLVGESMHETETKHTKTVSSLKGMLKGKNVDEGDYQKYLDEKFL